MRVELVESGSEVTTRLIISGISVNMSGTYRCETELGRDTQHFGQYLSESIRLSVISQLNGTQTKF